MLPVSAVKSMCFAEPRFVVQKKFYSRFAFANLKFCKVKNDLRAKMDLFSGTFYSRYVSFKAANNVKQNSAKILKSWSEQFEYVVADRIRRSLNVFSLYRKWWGDSAAKLLLQRMSLEMMKRNKFYFTAGFTPLFQWNEKRIQETELLKLKNEIENSQQLLQNVESCDENVKNGEYIKNNVELENHCQCNRCRHLPYDGWSLFYTNSVHRFKVWRKEHVDHPGEGLYVYKVYGKFDDVTANDFFRVQIDTNYRKEWDENVVELDVVESDSVSNSDIIYWEFLFPRMFYNRDYVYNRRYSVDENEKLMTIVNESIEHPACPERPPIHRVKEYWSHTVVRPTSDNFDEEGVEFTITYFDNPELIIPSYISVWYTVTGMPDYILKQRDAALYLAERRKKIEKENLIPVYKEYEHDAKARREMQQVPEKRVLLY